MRKYYLCETCNLVFEENDMHTEKLCKSCVYIKKKIKKDKLKVFIVFSFPAYEYKPDKGIIGIFKTRSLALTKIEKLKKEEDDIREQFKGTYWLEEFIVE